MAENRERINERLRITWITAIIISCAIIPFTPVFCILWSNLNPFVTGSAKVRKIGILLLIYQALLYGSLYFLNKIETYLDYGGLSAFIIMGAFPFVMLFLAYVFVFIKSEWRNVFELIGWSLLIPNLFLVGIAAPSYQFGKYRAVEAETKSNLHTIKTALERYSSSHDNRYPGNINLLYKEEIIHILPHNPFKKNKANIEEIAFGQDDFEGNFTYLPVEIDGSIKGYYLFCYGWRKNPGQDINNDGIPDHVILVLKSEFMSESENAENGVDKLPPVEDLL